MCQVMCQVWFTKVKSCSRCPEGVQSPARKCEEEPEDIMGHTRDPSYSGGRLQMQRIKDKENWVHLRQLRKSVTLSMKNECGGEGLVLTRKLVEDEIG